jgi:hypothetical protein
MSFGGGGFGSGGGGFGSGSGTGNTFGGFGSNNNNNNSGEHNLSCFFDGSLPFSRHRSTMRPRTMAAIDRSQQHL